MSITGIKNNIEDVTGIKNNVDDITGIKNNSDGVTGSIYPRGPKGDKGDKGEKGVDGKDAVTDQDYSPESANAQSGKAVAQAIATIPGVTIDTAMSDKSENPVQNKVIKGYVVDYVESITAKNFKPEEGDFDLSNLFSGYAVNDMINEHTFYSLSPTIEGEEIGGIASPSAVVNYVNNYAELKPQWELLKEVELTEAVSAYSEKVEALGDTTKGVRVALYLPPNTTLASNGITFTSSLVGSSAVAVDVTDWKSNTAETFCVFETKHNDLLWDIAVSPYTKKTRQIFESISVKSNSKVRYIKFTNSTLPIGTKIKIWGLM